MVSFTCCICQDVVKKNQIDKHCARSQCSSAWHFTCIDCNKTFEGYEYQSHTSCISEEDKYYGKFATKKKKENTSRSGNLETKHPTEKESHEDSESSTVVAVETTQASHCGRKESFSAEATSGGYTDPSQKKRKRTVNAEPNAASSRPASLGIPWDKLIEEALTSQQGDSIGLKPLAKQVVKIVISDGNLSGECHGLSKKQLLQKCLNEASVPAKLLSPETPLRLHVTRSA
eukprot:GHVS01047868.1.p1 GENE.GHVS01047868.1~~GHVS01047868.1.p1  ORF type:complete len:231 (+),score=21.94 GHVS01047868.1:164-856(+)